MELLYTILGLLIGGGGLYLFTKNKKVDLEDPFKGQVERLEEKLEELEENKPVAEDKDDKEVVDFWGKE